MKTILTALALVFASGSALADPQSDEPLTVLEAVDPVLAIPVAVLKTAFPVFADAPETSY